MQVVHEVSESSIPYHTNLYVPANLLHKKTGFQSMFGYVGVKNGERPIKGQTPLYLSTLILDLDSPDETRVRAFLDSLTELQISWQLYDSGSKGVHIHIPVVPIWGPNIYIQAKAFAEELKQTMPEVDTSIYHVSGLIRLPGTKHAKTGRHKTLLREFKGSVALQLPKLTFKMSLEENPPETPSECLGKALNWLALTLRKSPGLGERHQTLWAITKLLAESGLPSETALTFIETVNDHWDTPKTYEELVRALNDGYKIK